VRPLPRSRHVPRQTRGALDRQWNRQMNRRLYRHADRWLRRRDAHRLRQVNGHGQ
jgi:hypothetical protein